MNSLSTVLMPISEPAVKACSAGTPISQHTGAMTRPSIRCSVIAEPAMSGSRPSIALARCYQGDEHNQHGDDVEQQFEAGGGALADGVHGALGDRGNFDLADVGALAGQNRHHQLADEQ